jgi:hypothetical protein
MSLWWWPGLAIIDVSLIRSVPGWGMWVALALVVLSLLIECGVSGWDVSALLPALALLLLSTLVVTVIGWLSYVGGLGDAH